MMHHGIYADAGAVAMHSTQQVKEWNTGALDETCPKSKYPEKKLSMG